MPQIGSFGVVPGFERHIERMMRSRVHPGEGMRECEEVIERIKFNEERLHRPFTAFTYATNYNMPQFFDRFDTEYERNYVTHERAPEQTQYYAGSTHFKPPPTPMQRSTTYHGQFRNKYAPRERPYREGFAENNPQPNKQFLRWKVARGSVPDTSTFEDLRRYHLSGDNAKPTITPENWRDLIKPSHSEYTDNYCWPSYKVKRNAYVQKYEDPRDLAHYSRDSTQRADYEARRPFSPTPCSHGTRPKTAHGIIPETKNSIYMDTAGRTEYNDRYCTSLKQWNNGYQLHDDDRAMAVEKPERTRYKTPEQAYISESTMADQTPPAARRPCPPSRPPAPTPPGRGRTPTKSATHQFRNRGTQTPPRARAKSAKVRGSTDATSMARQHSHQHFSHKQKSVYDDPRYSDDKHGYEHTHNWNRYRVDPSRIVTKDNCICGYHFA